MVDFTKLEKQTRIGLNLVLDLMETTTPPSFVPCEEGRQLAVREGAVGKAWPRRLGLWRLECQTEGKPAAGGCRHP